MQVAVREVGEETSIDFLEFEWGVTGIRKPGPPTTARWHVITWLRWSRKMSRWTSRRNWDGQNITNGDG